MIEGLSKKEERLGAEELTLEELEGQTVELLPNRVEMRRHRRRTVIINNCGNNATGAASLITASPVNCF